METTILRSLRGAFTVTDTVVLTAARAGIGQAPLLQEPIAAGLAYGYQRELEDGYFIVYDLGGGTFDVTLLQQVVQAMEEIARVMEANQDCDRMVDGLERIAVRVRPLISRAKEIEKQKARSEWFKHEAEAQLTATVQRMLAPLQRCAQNKRLLALMQSLGS